MADIPKAQKAVIYDQPGTVSTKIVDLEVPEPGAGEVLINLYVWPELVIAPTILTIKEHTRACVTPTSVS